MKKSIALCGFIICLAFLATGCNKQEAEASAKTTVSPTEATATVSSYDNPATVEGDLQTVTTRFSYRRYAPITVQVGIPVKWTIQMDEKDLNGCNNEIIISGYDIDQPLAAGDTVVTFTPEKTGTIPYSCWMGMIRSSITVVDDLGGSAANKEPPAAAPNDISPPDGGVVSGSCCS